MTDKKLERRTLIKAYGIRFVIMVDAKVKLKLDEMNAFMDLISFDHICDFLPTAGW